MTQGQIETIPQILTKNSIVLASPTASGKTEAVVAPVAELFLSEKWHDLAILYIVPTRALANDTFERISGPLKDMGIVTKLKHGDNPYLSNKKLPNVLITTPESLDSLICRREKIFSTLKTVIIDEIHLFDNTYRGDQLRIILPRLCALVPSNNLLIHLLSATFSDPEMIANRYLKNFHVIRIPGMRMIRYDIVASLAEVVRIIREKKIKKCLFFCNMRQSVEKIASELGEMMKPYPVVAHHGSLGKSVREHAEMLMKEAEVAACVSTSTLEIGIDIGNIELIILAEIPWSISSLLQRIGRGNRRTGEIYVIGMGKSESELKMFKSMFELAISGQIPIENYKADLSVIVQQIFSILFQHRAGVTEEQIFIYFQDFCSRQIIQDIIKHLIVNDFIECTNQFFFPATKLLDLAELGKIHSNIPDNQEYRVFDVDTHKNIGVISGIFDRLFVLARQTWQVKSISYGIIWAKRYNGTGLPAIFNGKRNKGAFDYLLPKEYRNS